MWFRIAAFFAYFRNGVVCLPKENGGFIQPLFAQHLVGAFIELLPGRQFEGTPRYTQAVAERSHIEVGLCHGFGN